MKKKNICGERLSTTEIKDISVHILDVIVAFCKENEIAYSLAGGTLLGAIRHKGFIPWDDDIDICMKKKEIYFLQGNRNAYIEQLWQLVLEHKAGNLNLYRELKKQYSVDEWLIKREEIFKKLPVYAHVERLYKEEKLYDRLLAYVLNSPGLYAMQEYEKVLKKEYPEQILEKYKDLPGQQLLPFTSQQQYNRDIKTMFEKAGLDRIVTVINPKTREEEKKRLCDIASSHLARRTFIGNLYKETPDPNIIGKMSGHKEGSRAFSRYRDIVMMIC